VKIAAFAGGWPPGTSDRYASIVTNGFRQAELDLGPTVKYYFSRWSPDQLAADLEQAIDSKPDGIVLVGLLSDTAAGPLVDKAFAQGTIVTTTVVGLPEAQKKYASQGMGYVGARTRDAGLALGGETTKRAGIKAGDSVFVRGYDGSSRTEGLIAAMDKIGAKVIFREVPPLFDPGSAVSASKQLVEVMSANPDVKAVVTDDWYLTASVGSHAMIASLKPGQVFFAGEDVDYPNSARAMKDGYLNLALDQQPYLQGYLPILNICLTKKFGFSGLNVDTAGAFIDSANVDSVAALVEKGIR
jgi:simple sugar transport system substrate-binding protein